MSFTILDQEGTSCPTILMGKQEIWKEKPPDD